MTTVIMPCLIVYHTTRVVPVAIVALGVLTTEAYRQVSKGQNSLIWTWILCQ